MKNAPFIWLLLTIAALFSNTLYSQTAPPATKPVSDTLAWSELLDILQQSGQLTQQLAQPNDSLSRQQLYQLLVKSLAGGVLSTFDDPNYPDFIPTVNTALNTVGVNPDFIYGYTKVDGKGVYRLSGYRGEGLFIQFDFIAGGLGVMDKLGPSAGVLDIDQFTLGPNGEFSIVLSEKRPENYSGDWYPMNPATQTINMRQASYHWGVDKDARIAIERLDIKDAPQPLSADQINQRLKALMAYPKFYAGFALQHINHLKEKGFINKLEHDDWAGRGGIKNQHYYQGLFKLEPGHVLLLETELPESVRYWNVQLSDRLWNSIDWMNHQSSINGAQAIIDNDGRFRAVIAVDDPGVANWLDPGGLTEGSLMLRWSGASSGPLPSLRSIAIEDLSTALPADTRWISPEQRDQQLRERRRQVQLRRRW